MTQQTYSSLGAELNIPAELLIEAGLELGTEVSVIIADGVLVISAAEPDLQRSLTDELSYIMEELGYDPEQIYTVTEDGDDSE